MMIEGQKFSSKSKIQDEPEIYIFPGIMAAGDFFLKHDSDDRTKDVLVDRKWFGERVIKLLDN